MIEAYKIMYTVILRSFALSHNTTVRILNKFENPLLQNQFVGD